MEWLILLIVWPLLMLLHELGHVICGLVMGYKLDYIGFSRGSIFPHVAMTAYRETRLRHSVFLLGGFLSTLTLFGLFSLRILDAPQVIFTAFFVQLAIETNPFFSDFSMLLFYHESYLSSRSDITQLKEKIKEQWFSLKWYLHLSVWILLIVVLYRTIF